MVYYLSHNNPTVGAELMDAGRTSFNEGVEYADPDTVHWRAKKEHVIRQEQGYRVNPESMVKKMLWPSGDVELLDILPHWAVSPRFRDLVEQFEPNVHQFVPVEIYKERGGAPVATYYWFIVCQRIDSVDREHTTYAWKAPADDHDAGHWARNVRDPVSREFVEIPDAKLVFNRQQVADHHLWCDPRVGYGGDHLCSDSFADAATTTNFTGLGISHRETV